MKRLTWVLSLAVSQKDGLTEHLNELECHKRARGWGRGAAACHLITSMRWKDQQKQTRIRVPRTPLHEGRAVTGKSKPWSCGALSVGCLSQASHSSRLMDWYNLREQLLPWVLLLLKATYAACRPASLTAPLPQPHVQLLTSQQLCLRFLTGS